MKTLFVGIYDTNTVSLAPQILSAYARKVLSQKNLDIQTIEFSIFSDSVPSMIEGIKRHTPDLVCFSCYIWNYNLIKQITPHLNATIIVGGPQVTGIEKDILYANPKVDIIVTGEGEQTMVDLLDHFSGGKQLSCIDGITTRELQNPPLNPKGLVSLPPIYAAILEKNPDITWISFETSRGCPMECGYCTWGYSRLMRYFPLEYVLSELEIVLKHPSIREIYLADSSLLLNKKRAKTILDHIISLNSDKTIRYEFSPDELDDEIIERMLRLPSNEFNFGIQTINLRALKEIGRPFNKELFEKNYLKFIRAFPLALITIDLIYGLPEDNIEGYLESMNYVMSLPGVTRVLTNALIALPGSRFFKERHKYSMILADDDSFLVKENKTFSKDQMSLARRYSFYLNLLFLNSALKAAMLKLAEENNIPPAQQMIDFFDHLSFELVQGEYPATIPTVKKDFEHRNRVFGSVLKKFPQIVDEFRCFSKHRYDSDLENYPAFYSTQYYKMKKFAGQTAGE